MIVGRWSGKTFRNRAWELYREVFRKPLTVYDCTCPAGTFDGLRQHRTDPGGAHLWRCPYARSAQEEKT